MCAAENLGIDSQKIHYIGIFLHRFQQNIGVKG